MPIFNLWFNMDNAAFEESPTGEAGRILRKLADDFEQGRWAGEWKPLRDVNGNSVGEAEITGRDDL